MWLECPLCLNRCEVEDESDKRLCLCKYSSSNGERMVPAPWDRYLDEKLWAMYAAHAPTQLILGQSYNSDFSKKIIALAAAEYADALLVYHKKRWDKKNEEPSK